MKRLLLSCLSIILFCFHADGKEFNPSFKVTAKNAILIDTTTGDVLFDRNSTEQFEPASTTKIMTAYLVLDYLKDQRISLNDKHRVSVKAWKRGGSSMFLKEGETPSVHELLVGVITLSGNDASITLAEGLGGSEEDFAEEMTVRAKELGAKNSVFRNVTGWPDSKHLTTARDLAMIAWRTILDYPAEYKKYYSMLEYTHNKIKQTNRNPLLFSNMVNADGLKTGVTNAAGFCLVASAVEKSRRLILVTAGAKSARDRARDSENLMSWGFREFANYNLFDAGAVLEKAPVWFGDKTSIGLTVAKDAVVTLPKVARRSLKAEIIYNGPIQAPIQKGQQIGKLVVTSHKCAPREIPLVATENVEEAGFIRSFGHTVRYLIMGSE